jgi:hypothetical protein
MAKRRHLRGKKLLIVSGAIAGVSFIGCGDDATANLIAPPDTGAMDSAADADDGAADSTVTDALLDTNIPFDAVANLIAPPDVGPDTGDDGSADGG